MLTYKKVNQALRVIDPTAELIKGDGYHYFAGDSVQFAYTTSVMANSLNSLSLDAWVGEFVQMQNESRKSAQ